MTAMHDDPLRPDPIRAARDEVARPGVRPADTKAPGERPGDFIDRYKLLQEIGEGGMGTVWMAEQKEPVVRKVALKIIKLGMDTKEVVTRFEAERQALALMDHPSIAKVLDGGATSTGRPFFVMELVKGIPITQYCDEAKLSLRDRLALFAKVCEAIQHAHTKGIIHRDVKPSNVLVTLHDGTPLPKVIDFGIAKATSAELTKKTMFTQFAQMVGTPEYMAPEQAAMSALDIDTRADIYSLGVLLYELLTGTKPFEITKVLEKGYQELLRTIREDDPAKPSTRVSTLGDKGTTIAARRHVHAGKLSGHLRGDLDWIVMKALEKDRTRRYETANGFALDVQRYLRGDAVLAAPPSATYRLRKFVGRRKKTVAAVAAIAFLLVAGSIGTGLGWYETQKANAALDVEVTKKEEQRQLADAAKTRAETAETAAKADAERAKLAEAEAQKRAAELEQVSEFQAKQLSDLDVPLMGVRLRQSLLDAAPEDRREALANSLTGLNFTSLSLKALDQNLFGRTIEAIDTQFANQPLVRARLLHSLGDTLRKLGLYELAVNCLEQALAIRRRELGNDHLDTVVSINILGHALGDLHRNTEQAELFREELAIRRRVQGAEHSDTMAATSNMACVLLGLDKFAEAEPLVREALAGLQGAQDREAGRAAVALGNLAIALDGQRRFVEAEACYRESLASLRHSLGDRNPTTLHVITNLATSLLYQGRDADAELLAREALDGCREVLGNEHYLTLRATSLMGRVHLSQCRHAEAEACLREALAGYRRLLGDDNQLTLDSKRWLGSLLMKVDKLDEAESVTKEALAGFRRILGDENARTLGAQSDLCLELIKMHRFVAAETCCRAAIAPCRRLLGDSDPTTLNVILALGYALDGQEKPAEAEPILREAVTGYRAVVGAECWDTLNAMSTWGRVLTLLDRCAEAEPYCRDALAGLRRVRGDADESTLLAIGNMGLVLYRQHKPAEAEPYFREALAGWRALRGDADASTRMVMGLLGVTLQDLGKPDEAERLFREVLQHGPAVKGAEDTYTMFAIHGLGGILLAKRNLDEAEPLLREALAGQRRLSGPLNVVTLTWINDLSAVLHAQGHIPESESLLREAVAGWRQIDTEQPTRLISLSNLSGMLAGQGRFADAEPFAIECVEATRRAKTPNLDMLGNALASLGMSQFEIGKAAAAEAALAESLEIRDKILPKNDWRLRSVRNYLGAAMGKQGRFAEGESILVEGAEWMLTNPAMPSAQALGADRAGAAAQRAAEFYEAWHATEPGKGHDEKAAAWRARLAEHQARSSR